MYYLSKKWFALLICGTIGTVGIAGYICGYEVANQRAHEINKILTEYASLLERENSRLNHEIKGKE
jgi:hypothetical protein